MLAREMKEKAEEAKQEAKDILQHTILQFAPGIRDPQLDRFVDLILSAAMFQVAAAHKETIDGY